MSKKKTCTLISDYTPELVYAEEDCSKLKQTLYDTVEQLITEKGVTKFISSLTIGSDMFFAETVLHLKQHYPYISLEIVFACEIEASIWSCRLAERYYCIAERCDKETYISKRYTPSCFDERELYKLNNSEEIIFAINDDLSVYSYIEKAKRTSKTITSVKQR